MFFIVLLVSMALLYSITGSFMAFTFSSFSLEMPTTTSWSLNCFWNSFSSGMALRQGPHHVAQKSTRMNLPSVSGCAVSHFSTVSAGAFSLRNDLAHSCLPLLLS